MATTPRPSRRLQPSPRSTSRARAESLFVQRATEALPSAGWDDLCAIADGPQKAAALTRACHAWAVRWRVDADAMRTWARGFVIAYRTLGWHAVADRQTLRLSYRSQRGWSDAEIVALDPARERLAAWDALPVQRRKPDDDPTAPLSADPFAEDRKAFLARAEQHWEARHAAITAESKYADVFAAPDLPQHVEWLVRYQIQGESWGTIARGVGRNAVSVTEGAKHVADAIGLTLRPGGKGGRRARASNR